MKNCAVLSLSVVLLIVFGFKVVLTGERVVSVEQLSFMEGEWKGEGWIKGRGNSIKRFSQSEIIKNNAIARVLEVQGLGYEIDSIGCVTDRVVHKASGKLAFNAERGYVTMVSIAENHGERESDMILTGRKKLQWSFKDERSGGTIRFTEDFSKEGEWLEIGEISINNKDWHQFFEMRLTKTK